MHDVENGHKCPDCGDTYTCTIEDGACENGGQCDDCASNLDSWAAEQQAAYDDNIGGPHW